MGWLSSHFKPGEGPQRNQRGGNVPWDSAAWYLTLAQESQRAGWQSRGQWLEGMHSHLSRPLVCAASRPELGHRTESVWGGLRSSLGRSPEGTVRPQQKETGGILGCPGVGRAIISNWPVEICLPFSRGVQMGEPTSPVRQTQRTTPSRPPQISAQQRWAVLGYPSSIPSPTRPAPSL